MLTPSRNGDLDSKVLELNEKINSVFKDENVVICANDNFCTRDNKIIDRLYHNDTKLSSQGVRVLSGNLRRALSLTTPRRSPQQQNRGNFRKDRNYGQYQYRNHRVNNRLNTDMPFDSSKLAANIAQAIASAFI